MPNRAIEQTYTPAARKRVWVIKKKILQASWQKKPITAGEQDSGGLGPLHRDIQGQDTVEIINHCDSLKPFLCIAIQISTVFI